MYSSGPSQSVSSSFTVGLARTGSVRTVTQEVGTAGRPSGEAPPHGGAKMPQKHLICFERTLFKNGGGGGGGGGWSVQVDDQLSCRRVSQLL